MHPVVVAVQAAVAIIVAPAAVAAIKTVVQETRVGHAERERERERAAGITVTIVLLDHSAAGGGVIIIQERLLAAVATAATVATIVLAIVERHVVALLGVAAIPRDVGGILLALAAHLVRVVAVGSGRPHRHAHQYAAVGQLNWRVS